MDCTPYPHYLDFLMPFILLSGFVGLPLAVALFFILRRSRYERIENRLREIRDAIIERPF